MRIVLTLFLAFAALAGSPSAPGQRLQAQNTPQFQVVVHPTNPVDAVTVDQLSDIFLRRQISWASGQTALPVDQPGRAPVRDEFSAAVMNRSTRAVVAHWQQQIFSGRGVPPVELPSDEAVLEYVGTHPGAVGYVSTGARTTGLKVVEVTR